jgi:hypothetical protein
MVAIYQTHLAAVKRDTPRGNRDTLRGNIDFKAMKVLSFVL